MLEPQTVRVLFVDDNPAVLRQVVQLLPPRYDVVETLSCGAGLAAAMARHRPDVVVLDISLPGNSGIALATQLGSGAIPIVFLTVHHDPDYVRAAFEAGACGYVVKMRLSLDLIPALEAAMAGRRFISPLPELRID